ncbi:LysR family transcriptional regulator [Polyangium sp. 15x6]|uniref:LysR family transcriptional regulator n=1 Tax=Polyangium sp. 15x6 TaxID=3042687 RepID=UPI00249A9AE5|nr:LysR family transcriptional regulator [Polyangium sp. 15x6]MDI3284080.1 LysR family transcriptional regulator [Polyangium sp. 15x6]
MLDTVTLDQLRVFITAADEGSFSAAARKLRRVQSAVSQAIGNLEAQLGVALWDRSTKLPTLTAEGRSMLLAARRVVGEADSLRKLAAGMVTGLEASVSLCVDALFPVCALVDLCRGLASAFPSVDLRVDTQPTSLVAARVLSGAATLGVVGAKGIPSGLERQVLSPIRMIPVVSVEHPLARHEGRIPASRFAEHVQVVLAAPEQGDDHSVLSVRTFCVADLATKHAFVRAGLGWGNLPEHVVQADVRSKRLARIQPEPWGEGEHVFHLSAIYRPDAAFGPVHRWILAELQKLCPRDAGLPHRPPEAKKRRRTHRPR